MSNFISTFRKGNRGETVSLSTGLTNLDLSIGGVQQGMSIGLAAAPKVGKTTFADYAFVLGPYLYCERNNMLDKLHIEYFSYEVNRIKKEFKFTAFFMFNDFGINEFEYKGRKYEMSGEYLMGKLLDEDQDGDKLLYVKVTEEHKQMVKTIYNKRIIPLFGEYNEKGKKIKSGIINVMTVRKTPEGMKNHIMAYAKAHGTFDTEGAYVPNDPSIFVIVVTDHVRKPKREKGLTIKENIDKWLGDTTEMRDVLNYIFINIVHSNRGVSNIERLRTMGENIFPTSDDSKDTGNIAEESTIFMTLFNANDEKYNLEKHFGHVLKEYPNYRSLHITESRDTFCPMHIFYNMYGGVNLFTPLI